MTLGTAWTRLWALAAVLLFSGIGAAYGQTQNNSASPDRRPPKIALALSGGGASATAHVGVIRALEQAGLRPDCVAGTSMGAIIGGLYAAGLTPDQLRQAVEDTDWKAILSGQGRNAQLHPIRRRPRLESASLGSPLPLRASNGGGLRLDPALIDSGDLELRLRELASAAAGVEDFDRLEIPFRAVATDLATGEEVVIERGDLATAMLASMAIPGVFGPVRWNDRVLVDGGVANNLPIRIARDLCASGLNDIVIAASVPLEKPDEARLTTLTGSVSRTLSLFITKNTQQQILDLRPYKDVLISPPVSDIGTLEFEKAVQAVEIGYRSSRTKAIRLARRLSRSRRASAASLNARNGAQIRQKITVAELRLENSSFYKDEVVHAYLDIQPPTTISVAVLNMRLARLRALEAFDQVTYELEPQRGGGDRLTVYTRGREAGDVEFRATARFEDNFDGRAHFGLGAGIGFTGLNDLGLRLDVDGMFGDFQAGRVRIEQPLEPSQSWFLIGKASYYASPTELALKPSSDIAEYRLGTVEVGADLVWAPHDIARVEFGGRYRHRRVDRLSGDPTTSPGSLERQEAGPRFALDIDTLDDEFVPMHGLALGAELFVFADPLGRGDFEGEAKVEALGAYDMTEWGLNKFSVQAFLRASGDINGEDSAGLNTLGGFQRISGLKRDELADNVAGVVGARIISASEFVEQQTGFVAFWGGSVEYGGVYGSFEDVAEDGGVAAASAFAGVRTSFGPIYIGAGVADGGNRTMYLGFGERF